MSRKISVHISFLIALSMILTAFISMSTTVKANEIKDIVYGDLNGDGNADSIDYATLKMYLVGIIQLSEKQLKASDLNLDGDVNSIDFAHFKRYLLGMIKSLPVEPVEATPTPVITTPTPTSIIPTPTSFVKEGDIVLEPNGSMTLEQAIKSIQPGNTIYLKSGTYKYSKTIVIAEGNNGYPGAYKKIASYGNDKPIIDFSAMAENSSNRGIVLAGNYWHIKNITIHGAGDNGMLVAGHNNIIEACNFMYNRDSGLQLSRYNSSYTTKDKWPSNNLIVDCYSAENMDSRAEDADGFAAKLTCGEGNIFRNCKAEFNCDDGWDLYTKSDTGAIGVVIMENCEASNNGKYRSGRLTGGDGNGFKLGDDTASVPHILKNCTANYNVKHGFTGNGNPARIVMENCSGTGNGGKLFDRLNNAIFR
ncbi:dockerin type I domain-containing protein [Acetivibrio clariflavus]|uniref:dockerin type I domain-containing protein n=1 Tax=Acetivibrio clariflavus TaxID=288965 RepID=UPI0031F5CAE2